MSADAGKRSSVKVIRAKKASREIFLDEKTPEIIEKLSSLRRAKRITQAQVAAKMKTTASAVARLESGGGKKRHSPSLRTLSEYAKALACRVEMTVIEMDEDEEEEVVSSKKK